MTTHVKSRPGEALKVDIAGDNACLFNAVGNMPLHRPEEPGA
jgi:hypothetical protein